MMLKRRAAMCRHPSLPIWSDVGENNQLSNTQVLNFSHRLNGNANGITVEYVLPDFSRNRHGYIRSQPTPFVAPTISLGSDNAINVDHEENSPPEQGLQHGGVTKTREGDKMFHEIPPPSDSDQILYMSNERFTVPELIFNPSDIGRSVSTNAYHC